MLPAVNYFPATGYKIGIGGTPQQLSCSGTTVNFHVGYFFEKHCGNGQRCAGSTLSFHGDKTMRQLDGWFLFYQPKYRVPSVFDLHHRGLFQELPKITKEHGARMLVNNQLQVAIEYRFLCQEKLLDHGMFYNYATKQGILPLRDKLALDLTDLTTLSDPLAQLEVKNVYDQFCQGYLPQNSNGSIDWETVSGKLQNSLAEAKKQIREELKQRNGSWVARRVPALACRFFQWEQGRFADQLFEVYRNIGGQELAPALMTRIAQFYTIAETSEPDGLVNPDGHQWWANEDEMWECWVGFAGSEEEARRILHTMEKVLR